MDKPKLIFEDGCYPSELVDRINMILCDWTLDANEMWFEICKAEHYLYSHSDEPDFQGLPWQLSLETVPRENLLMIIMGKRVPGWELLMDDFGVVYTKEPKTQLTKGEK